MKKLLLTFALLLTALPVYASSPPVLLVGSNNSVANGVQVLGATTGNTPLIGAQGSDTNVGLIFTTQGTGALNLETAGSGNVILAPGSGNVTIPAFTASGIVFNNASGDLSSGTALPNGTTATTQSSGDNSTKVATTAYVDAATGGGASGMVLLATVDASNAASVSFGSTYITSTYNLYKLMIDSLAPGTNSVSFELQVSSDGGSTWKSSNYYWQLFDSTFSNSASYIDLGGGQAFGNAANQVAQFEITFSNPSASNITNFFVNGTFWNNGGTLNTVPLNGAYQTAGAINAVRFVFSSGNIATGNFHLYGLSGT